MAERIDWHEPTMRNDGATPSILAIGDSWFWYSLPGGQAVIGGSAWRKPALVAAGGPPALRAGCVADLIDPFSARLADIEAGDGGRVAFVDSRGALGPGDWANELHPTGAGFRTIARQRWRPVLAAAGLA